ncbi:hypothetical protein ACVWZ3_000858 [Bradyrhizobium sp. i1.3.6]
MGRGGYARARCSDFSGNPGIGHGSGLSSAAGSRCHGRVPGERRPGPPGNRAIRAARPRCERSAIPGAPAGPIRRNGGVSAGAWLCRPADLSAPTGVRQMSPVSGGLRSGPGRDRCSTCGRASLGLGCHVPLGRHGGHPYGGNRRYAGWTAGQLARHGRTLRWAALRGDRPARRDQLAAHPQGRCWNSQCDGVSADAVWCADRLLV